MKPAPLRALRARRSSTMINNCGVDYNGCEHLWDRVAEQVGWVMATEAAPLRRRGRALQNGVLCALAAAAVPLLAISIPRVADQADWVAGYPERRKAETNLKNVGLALHAYHDANSHFPQPFASRPPTAPPQSWRWDLYPYLEQGCRIRPVTFQDMPRLFAPVRGPRDLGFTPYRMFVGSGAAFDRPPGTRLEDLADPANTLLVVEAAEAVPWTLPEGLPYDRDQPLPPLGGQFRGGFYALFADGSVRFIKDGTEEKLLRAYIEGRPLGK